jgi:pilus assembly protein Flp/PilA
MTKSVVALLNDRNGATMIEYCLIAALISVVCIGFLQEFGSSLRTTLNEVSTSMS